MTMEVWSWRHAVQKSGLPSSTKLVLLNLSIYMNDIGQGCFPSTKRQAMDTSLSERAVCEHLERAVQAGLLVKRKHGYGGRKWARNEYFAQMPPSATLLTLSEGGTDAGSARQNEALTLTTRGTDFNDTEALTLRQSNSSVNSPDNSSAKDFVLWKVLGRADELRAERFIRETKSVLPFVTLSRFYEESVRSGKRAVPADAISDLLDFIATFKPKRKRS